MQWRAGQCIEEWCGLSPWASFCPTGTSTTCFWTSHTEAQPTAVSGSLAPWTQWSGRRRGPPRLLPAPALRADHLDQPRRAVEQDRRGRVHLCPRWGLAGLSNQRRKRYLIDLWDEITSSRRHIPINRLGRCNFNIAFVSRAVNMSSSSHLNRRDT